MIQNNYIKIYKKMNIIFLFIIFIILGYLIKRWANGPINPIKKDMTGKLIIVTGSSDGIGLEKQKIYFSLTQK